MLRQNEFSVLLMLSFNLCAQQPEVSRTGDFVGFFCKRYQKAPSFSPFDDVDLYVMYYSLGTIALADC